MTDKKLVKVKCKDQAKKTTASSDTFAAIEKCDDHCGLPIHRDRWVVITNSLGSQAAFCSICKRYIGRIHKEGKKP